MLEKTRELILSSVVIVFSAIAFVMAGSMHTAALKYELSQPGNYVRLWVGLSGILGIILFIKALRRKDDKRAERIWHPSAIITVIVTVIYLVLLDLIGFNISTFLLVLTLGLVYTYFMKDIKLRGKTLLLQILKWAAVAAVTTVVLYFLFGKVLHVVLP